MFENLFQDAVLKIKYLLFFFIIAVFLLVVSKIIEYERINNLLEYQSKISSALYKHIVGEYKSFAEFVYKNNINQEDILKTFAAAETTPESSRKKLYDSLKGVYTDMERFRLRQLHFHLKNNESFLRFHRPSKFGDSLNGIRSTVEYVNKSHKQIFGFEEGRIFSGYRFVFPLFYNNNYIGSVETSIAMKVITDELASVLQEKSLFFIDKNIVDTKVFQYEHMKYAKSIAFPNHYFEKEKNSEGNIDKNIFYNENYLQRVEEKYRTKTAVYSFHKSYEGQEYIITIIPVLEVITQEPVAHIVLLKESKDIEQIVKQHRNSYMVVVVLLALVLYFLYTTKYKQQIILEQVEEIKSQEIRYQSIMELSSDGIHLLDQDGKLYEYSETFLKMLGYTREEAKDLNVYDWDVSIPKEEIKKVIQDLIRKPRSFETKHRRKDGTTFIAQITAKGITIDNKTYLYASSRDVTQEKEKTEAIRNKLQKFIDTQSSIVILTDGRHLNFANKTFLNFFGYKSMEDFLEDYDCICEHFLEKSGFFHLGLVKEDEKTWVESLLNLSGRKRIVRMVDKYKIPYAFTVSINYYEKGTYIVTFVDISDSMNEKFELTKEATKDPLTEVYNRGFFNKYIYEIIEDNKRMNFETGIVIFDIDKFKSVNDTYGHSVGDIVLKTIASMVSKNIREDDIIVRWGGEEFIIVMKVDKVEVLSKVAEHLRALIEKENFHVVGKVTCSFGCAMHQYRDDIKYTIEAADDNLYKAKKSGRNRVVC